MKTYAFTNFRNAEGELTGRLKMPAASITGTAIGALGGFLIGKYAKFPMAKKINVYNGAAVGLIVGVFLDGRNS
jgi:uncharacterized protein YcfJ